MPKYIVRPYYSYDCDSESGFNNGHYLSPIEVDATDADDAATKAMEAYIREASGAGSTERLIDLEGDLMDKSAVEIGGSFGDWTIYWEFDHVYMTEDGTEYSDADDIPLGDAETAIDPERGNWAQDFETRYRYRYIDFSQDVSEATNV